MRSGAAKSMAEVLAQAGAPRPCPPLSDKELHARRLAAWINETYDSKDNPEVDELMAEARRLGWLTP